MKTFGTPGTIIPWLTLFLIHEVTLMNYNLHKRIATAETVLRKDEFSLVVIAVILSFY